MTTPKRPQCKVCKRQRRPAAYVDDRPICAPCLSDTVAPTAATATSQALMRTLFDRARDGAVD